MDLEPLAGCEREQLQQPDRIVPEEIIGRDGYSPTIEHETAEPFWAATDRRQGEAKALPAHLLVELCEENPGQVADRLRVEEIELHEALDRRFARPVGIIHDL